MNKNKIIRNIVLASAGALSLSGLIAGCGRSEGKVNDSDPSAQAVTPVNAAAIGGYSFKMPEAELAGRQQKPYQQSQGCKPAPNRSSR